MDRLQTQCASSAMAASWRPILGAVGVMLWATETTLINLAPHIPPLQIVALAFAFAALLTPIVWT